MLADKKLYEIFKAKDTRFDGRFFVGITSTGIYCRPICRARQPKIENCAFFMSAAEAEHANFRPCLLCRPELAPGNSIADATKNLAKRAAYLLESNCGQGRGLEKIAQQLGCSSRHLRRIFLTEYGVSPIQYLQTCRLLLAKNLLTDTQLSILDVAMAAGFGSLRRFNDLFQKHYKLSPSFLRKKKIKLHYRETSFQLCVGYRPPYNWDEVLDFLRERSIPGVEVVHGKEYYRTVLINDYQGQSLVGWIKIGHLPRKNALSVTISESLIAALPQILGKIRHLFDLDCDPYTIFNGLSNIEKVGKNICVLGTRVPGCFNSYEMTVRAVLGQQITIKAATTIIGRFVEKLGTPLQTEVEGLTHVFPTPEKIMEIVEPIEDLLGPLGIIKTRARTIKNLSEILANEEISLEPGANLEYAMAKLLAVPGIGAWTAKYILMRSVGWTDAFLETDAGIKKALSAYSSNEIQMLSQEWQPWRSYATVSLWNSLHKEE